MSTQDAILQAYEKDRAANQKRKADDHAVIAEGIAKLACQQTEYETRRHLIDEEFASRETTRENRFNADTAKQNKLNKEMENSKRHHEIQRQLVKEMKNMYKKLERESEQAAYMVDVLNEHYANQVVDILNSFPPSSWVLDQSGSSSSGTRDIRNDAVRLIRSMTVNTGPWNKTEHWDSVKKVLIIT